MTEVVWKSQGAVLKGGLNLAASAEPQNQQILLQGGFPPAMNQEGHGVWLLSRKQNQEVTPEVIHEFSSPVRGI